MLPAAGAGGAAQQQRPDGFTPREQAYRQRLGDRGYARFEAMKRDERQRVWDAMRKLAGERHRAGLMPAWFRPEWLDLEEAPTNSWWRQQGLSAYQRDATWLGDSAPPPPGGGGDGGGSSGGGGGGGWRWWREEDPYWPLRDWGDHPMRWWTWALAGALAAGGLLNHARSGSAGALHVGFGAAALLGMAAAAMSDMRGGGGVVGELGVKAAFATCAALALADFNGRGLAPPPRPDPACELVHTPEGLWALRPIGEVEREAAAAAAAAAEAAATSSSSAGGSLGSWTWESRLSRRFFAPRGAPRGGSSSAGRSAIGGVGGGDVRATGWLCAAACAGYMLTGMSGLSDYALPTNPGAAFKMVDVAAKSKVWERWGYGQLTMRT